MEAKANRTPSIPQETISWLLASQTPSIRYLTLTQLLGKLDSNPEVKSLRSLIPTTKPVTAILSRQDPEGFWSGKRRYYSPKYRSSHWTMYLLTELAVPAEHPAMQLGAAFMLQRMEGQVPYYHREESIGFCCFWGNWLRYQIHCGNLANPGVQKVIDFVCKDLHRLGKCRYNNYLPCAWGVIRSLFGLAIIPQSERNADIEAAISRGIQFILADYNLLDADFPCEEKVHPLWHKLSFPLFYHTDILFVLRILKELNTLDHPGAQSAVQWLRGKQTQKGVWRGGSPFRSRTRPFLVEPDSPSHWITLQAASIIAAAG